MNLIMLLASLVVGAGLFIDAYFYPGALLKYAGVDSKVILFGFTILLCLRTLKKRPILPSFALRINKTILFPALAVFSALFILLENLNYENYVLGTFGFHYEQFLIITGFSGLFIYLSRDMKKYQPYKKAFYLAGPIFLLAMILLHVVDTPLFDHINQEDHVIEFFQFASFLAAGIISFQTAKLLKKKNTALFLFSLLFGLGLIFIAGEEISWGQRIIGLETPDSLKEINYQNETNIHNIQVVHRATNKYCVNCFIGLWGVAGTMMIHNIKLIPQRIRPFLVPGGYLIFYFLAIGVFSLLYEYVHWYYEMGTAEKTGIHFWQEVAETYLALGFLMFVWDNYQRAKNK